MREAGEEGERGEEVRGQEGDEGAERKGDEEGVGNDQARRGAGED
jgi:hypothetical protein